MASVPVAALALSPGELEFFYHHVFLPPLLPQAADDSERLPQLESALFTAVVRTLKIFRDYYTTDTCKAALKTAISGLVCAGDVLNDTDATISETALRQALRNISDGTTGILPLYVRAQNAAIFIARTKDGMVFEAFELSATNHAVVKTKGRLIRQFPGCAASVDSDTFKQQGLQEVIAQALSKMSDQPVSELQPKTAKAGSVHEEERDTTHPGAVTELFMGGFLKSFGRPSRVQPISKNTRDEVLWHNAETPWRRSPFWLFIRVFLQVTLSRRAGSEGITLYKAFMAFFLTWIRETARKALQPSEVLYAMGCKIFRRMHKLTADVPLSLRDAVNQGLSQSGDTIHSQWKAIRQRNERHAALASLSTLQFDRDSYIEFAPLDRYLEALVSRGAVHRRANVELTSGLGYFSPRIFPSMTELSATNEYRVATLQGFEGWTQNRATEIAAGWKADKACRLLHESLLTYHTEALKLYNGNAEALSNMVLSCFELWIALDKRATSGCEMLREYDPGVSGEVLQSLLLPSRHQMSRLNMVEKYIADRRRDSRFPQTQLFSHTDHNCFPVRYFDHSQAHCEFQTCMDGIIDLAEREKSRKIAELASMKRDYDRLIQLRDESKCDMVQMITKTVNGIEREELKHDDAGCRKCSLNSRATKMAIKVHEWPLSRNVNAAKTTVFELRIPPWLGFWRDGTVYMLTNILHSTYAQTKQCERQFRLANDPHLERFFKQREKQRIGLRSDSKAQTQTHYKWKKISGVERESQVCVENGFNYRYADNDIGCFVTSFKASDTVARDCTYRVPERTQSLEEYIFRPAAGPNGPPPNTVIATQSACPEHMTIDEYMELCSIPLGHMTQWLSIALQLRVPKVDFKKEETAIVILQCIYQAGPPNGSSLRAAHAMTANSDFARLLVGDLKLTLEKVRENWESANSVLILVAIASRLLSLNLLIEIQSACLSFLEAASNIVLSWVHLLREKATKAPGAVDRREFRLKAMELALICVVCFDVDEEFMASVLSERSRASTLLQCSIVVGERALHKSNSPGTLMALLSWRFKRVLHRGYSYLAFNQAGLNDAIGKAWTDYEPSSSGWSQLSAGMDHWIYTETTSSTGSINRVHFDLLSGKLFINESRLARPPVTYESHELFCTLFESCDVEVFPSTAAGMRFSATKQWAGYNIDLGWHVAGDLLVQARRDDQIYEVVPTRFLCGKLPTAFETDFVHWYNKRQGTVEFRPKSDPWNATSSGIWILKKQNEMWRLTRNKFRVLGLCSPTSTVLAEIFSPLSEAGQVHIVMGPESKSITAEIPGLQLTFSLDLGASELKSTEYRGMAVDEDQSIDTMVGLSSKLLLKPLKTGKRLMLVAEGPVTYKKVDDHIRVAVDRTAIEKVHPIQIDVELGRLIDTGSLQCKLFMAYLHAVTSFCCPDPLTGQTGTEQALTILSAAATLSFEQLSKSNLDTLFKIANLTAGRRYYPSEENRSMQSVLWDPELSFLAQDSGLHKAVESMFAQASRSKVFYPETKISLPTLQYAHEDLLDRDLTRSSTFRVAEFGAEHHSTGFDEPYHARDRGQKSERALNACVVSAMLFQKIETLHWPALGVGDLVQIAANITTMLGPNTLLEKDHFRYDSTLLQMLDSTLVRQLPALHATFLAGNKDPVNKFAVMMWLSTMAFSTAANLTLLQAVVVMFTTPMINGIQLPQAESFSPNQGRTAGGLQIRDELIDLVLQTAIGFKASPEATLPSVEKESRRNADQRRLDLYNSRIRNAAKDLVLPLQKKWSSEELHPAKAGKWSGYIDVPKAMELLNAKFKIYRDNVALYEYLSKIENTISGMTRKAQVVPLWSLGNATPFKKTAQCYFTVDDLFAGPVPVTLPILRPPPLLALAANSSSYNDEKETVPSEPLLRQLIDRLRGTGGNYEAAYLDNLESSLLSMKTQHIHQVDRGQLPSPSVFRQYLVACNTHFKTLHNELKRAMTSACVEKLLSSTNPHAIQHLPRVSSTFFLRQLSRHRWYKLSHAWKETIIRYGLALAMVQRAERLLSAADPFNELDLIKEMKNVGHTNWDPMIFPEYLLLEVENGLLIREVQEEIAAQMRSPPGAKNSVMQLDMGEGKSSVIVPMVAAALADRSLVRVVVAKPQSKQMAQMLTSKLGGLLDRRIYYMPFSRAIKLTKSRTEAMKALCEECMANGGILLLQPEHILSFRLMGPECYISDKIEIGEALLRIQDYFDHTSRDIVDESDENFDVRFELIYTMGAQRPIEMSGARWSLIQQILGLVKKYASIISKANPVAVEFDDRGAARSPRIRVLQPEAMEQLLDYIANDVCDNGLRGFPVAGQPESVRTAVKVYITHYELGDDQKKAVEKGPFWTENYKPTLLLLRGLLATGILNFSFSQKRWRVNYGLTVRSPPTRLAVPYSAKDRPNLLSEFSHPDVVIVLTSLAYYYGGLDDEHLFLAFGHLMKSDQASVEYQLWVQGINMPQALKQLEGINLRDRLTCTSLVFPPLRHAKGVIDYFLAYIVFPKEMREFPYKLSASGWDIGKVKSLPTTGFSGTNDSKDLLPMDMHHLDLEKQKHTNASVLNKLLQPENSIVLLEQSRNTAVSDAENLLNMVMSLTPIPEVILDVGAQILELDNAAVARAWLAKFDPSKKEAAVYCNEADEKTVVDRNGREEPLQTSSYALRLDRCIIYLDEAHTRGIDLKLPPSYRAAVTLGAGLTKDRLVQACNRMRQLGEGRKGQSIVFCISAEIQTTIKFAAKKFHDDEIELMDVLIWAITETFTETRRSIPLWVTQGHRFVCQEALWSHANKCGQTLLSTEHAKRFQEKEAQTIEARYRPGKEFETQLKKLTDPRKVANLSEYTKQRFGAIAKRCELFDQLQRNARRLQEEQERELAPEVEEERVIERAVLAVADSHRLHRDIIQLITTGKLKPGSSAYVPAFHTLGDTSAAAEFDVRQLVSSTRSNLLATADFARTVKKQGDHYMSDAFQRQIQWVLTIRQRANLDRKVDAAIVISPFEAQQLVERNIQTSTVAALHLYRPRCNLGYDALDRLDFYTVKAGPGNLEIPRHLSIQLNLFAGQLYFSSYAEYLETCNFLGLLTEKAKPGWIVAADNFILRDGRGHLGYGSELHQSPVKFLRTLLTKVRRNGEDIARTHIGRVLDGEILTREELGGEAID